MSTYIERKETCTNCGGRIIVRGEEPPGIVTGDIGIMVPCPGCRFPNPFEWTSDTPPTVTFEP